MIFNINKIPIIYYNNVEKCKFIIYSNNRGKSGIYCWVNRITKEKYVGSSYDLTRRLSNYFSINWLNKSLLITKSRIYSAMLKYDHSNFNLYILEYCNPDKLIEREQYYMDLFNPEYNILKIAGSTSGYKHSPETILKYKNRIISTEARLNMSQAKRGIPQISPLRLKNQLLARGYKIIIINKINNSIKQYPSIRSAAKDLNCHHTSLMYSISKNVLFKDTYLIIKLIKLKL